MHGPGGTAPVARHEDAIMSLSGRLVAVSFFTVVLLAFVASGCSARKAAVEPAPPVERKTEAPAPAPDRIS